jgi:hypothetical protein
MSFFKHKLCHLAFFLYWRLIIASISGTIFLSCWLCSAGSGNVPKSEATCPTKSCSCAA